MIEIISWENDFSDASRLSEERNKPIFVDWSDFPSCVGCVSLENTTYTNSDIADYINKHFVPLQLNQSQNRSWFEQNNVFWTPTLTICDQHGKEMYRWTGYLPPDEFLPKVKFGRAWLTMLSQEWVEAAYILTDVATGYGESLVAPDALYWLGVAMGKVSGDFDELSRLWANLIKRYPGSEAALKASCLAPV